MSEPRDPVAVRDAASLILLRRDGAQPQVLMGQRGAAAVFMPDKFVFPGGAVDAADGALAIAAAAAPATARALAVDAPAAVARALPLTAIRELWEETGLRLGRPDPAATALAATAPADWRGFLAGGILPGVDALRFMFRAVTPPGRPRRFDARFFVAEATALADDPEAFTEGDAELRHLCWIDLAQARRLPTPFITGVVLSEVEALLADDAPSRATPYFLTDADGSRFRLI